LRVKGQRQACQLSTRFLARACQKTLDLRQYTTNNDRVCGTSATCSACFASWVLLLAAFLGLEHGRRGRSREAHIAEVLDALEKTRRDPKPCRLYALLRQYRDR